jgi:hypothetical protein
MLGEKFVQVIKEHLENKRISRGPNWRSSVMAAVNIQSLLDVMISEVQMALAPDSMGCLSDTVLTTLAGFTKRHDTVADAYTAFSSRHPMVWYTSMALLEFLSTRIRL